MCERSLVVLLAVENPQYGEEQIDNIEIQADRRSDLLFHMIVPHDQLCVNQDVARKDQSRHPTIHSIHSLATREEASHESEDDEHPQGTKQIRLPRGEVVFALAGEEREEAEHG